MRPSADITVALPSIPSRRVPRRGFASLYDQARMSVGWQLLTPAGGISSALDERGEGAATTRQRALDAVTTEWVAFLDDDDYLYENHLWVLYDLVTDHSADYAYSWFSGENPFPGHRGRQLDPANPHHTTMTVMVRTELAKDVGFTPQIDPSARLGNEDWRFILGCCTAGARFIGTGEITWHYRRHRGKTGGMPGRV